MFWSKIWFFLITLAAAVALTIAFVLPRPAQRTLATAEATRLQVACGVIHILLTDDARKRVDLAGAFSRAPEIMNALEAASGVERLDEARMKQVRDIGEAVMKTIAGSRKPDFAMLIDKRGRVVARVRLDESDFGDVVTGRPLVDDALAGYLRDDLWTQNGTMYMVSGAPVVKQGSYVGAVVLGHLVTNQLAQRLVSSLEVDMAFHLGNDDVAGSKTLAIDHAKMQEQIGKLGDDITTDCQLVKPFDLRANNDDYTAVVARLPGEAAAKKAYYSVISKKPEALGFIGTIKTVKQNDLSFGNFPWLLVALGFILVLGVGIGLMFYETDRPLRRLTADAVRLAKGETERMSEDAHAGKFGSIARSVNIHIDKLGRDAKAAKKDLDQLLGPAPEGSLGTIDLLATALPSVRPGGPATAVPPPPSEFKFQDSGPSHLRAPSAPGIASRPPTPVPRAGTPPPIRTGSGPVSAQRPSVPSALPGLAEELDAPVDPHFKQVFDEFISLKRSCNESTSGLTYEKFAEKLVRNREDLMTKTGCREVRFTVYVKDGKAALKATPIKDEA